MPTASLEAMLDLWSPSLRDAKDQIRLLFAALSVARSTRTFLNSLIGAEQCKAGWIRTRWMVEREIPDRE